MTRLLDSFYLRDTTTVARELLGQRLVHFVDGERLSGIIVETEAYLGALDRACHGFGYRRTARTESLFAAGGHSYVYLIYGLYHCFNAVTRQAGEPEAVLVRALEPSEGIERQRALRGNPKKDIALTSGPGKLCRALAIDRSCDRLSLQGPSLFIEKTQEAPLDEASILVSSRIGVEYAGDDALLPLRFGIRGNPFLSRTFAGK